jgi:hypothetical protein
MGNIQATETLVIVLALGAVSVMVLLVRSKRTNRDLPIWLSSTIVGMMLGAGAAAAIATGLGYTIAKPRDVPAAPLEKTVGMGSSPGMGSGIMGGPGAGPGMGGPPGMGRGGPGMSPKGQLTTLVRKIELLTGDIKLTLTPEQSVTIATMLDELKASPTLTDDEANAKYEKLLAVLDDGQKAKQESIRLPFRGGGRPGGGPGGGGPGGPGGGPGGGRGGNQPPDANPFSDEENSKALSSLLSRLGGTKTPESSASAKAADAPKPEEAPTEK